MSLSHSKQPISAWFDHKGWHLEKGLLDLAAVREVLAFLITSRQHLQAKFAAWSGEKILCDQDYANHQAAIPEYEKRGLPKDLRHYLTGEFDLQTRLDQKIVDLLATAHVRSFLCSVLGSERYIIHYPPMIRFKVADSPGSILPPHQDGPYSPHLVDFMTVWVPLVDIDSECGGLVMFDGSHLGGMLEHGSSGPWAFGVKDSTNTYQTTHVEMKAGDALIFPASTIHASAPQRSSTRQRYSIDFRVIRTPEETTKSFFNPFTHRVTQRH